jgi:nicotinate-nucleotide adenylyltransferase
MAEIIKHTSSTPKSKQRIGIYGGSFNPIHIGHLETAKYLIDNGTLDEVRFLPNPCSPFKRNVNMPDAYHRAKCIQSALNTYPYSRYKKSMKIDTTEMVDSIFMKTCYTVNTLKHILYNEYDSENTYYLIIGADVFNSIKKFKKWRWFKEEKIVKFIILPRGGYAINEELEREFSELILPVDFGGFTPIELSSTEIRQHLREWNDDVKKTLSEGTLSYIRYHRLYDDNK